MLIRIPKPIADDEIGEPDPDPQRYSEITFVDPVSGIVIVVDEAAEEARPLSKTIGRRRSSPLWRSLLSRRLAAGSAIIAESLITGFGPAPALAEHRRLRRRSAGRSSTEDNHR